MHKENRVQYPLVLTGRSLGIDVFVRTRNVMARLARRAIHHQCADPEDMNTH